MKLRRSILVAMLLAMVPVLSACELLGTGNEQQTQRDYYEQQLKAIQKVQEANRQQEEAYYKQVQQGLDEWAKEYGEWQKQQQQQQVEQFTQQQTDNTG